VTLPDASVAVPPVKAQEPIAVPTDAPANSVSDDAERSARPADPTNNPGMPIIIFPVLALGLVGVGIVIKTAAARRARITGDQQEPETVDDQRQHEWRDEQYLDESLVDGQELRLLVSAVSEPGPLRGIQEISERKDKLVQFCRDMERMLQSPASPHEEPLRGRTAAVSDPGPLPDDDGAFPIAQENIEDKLVQFCRDYDRELQSLSPHEKSLRGRTAA